MLVNKALPLVIFYAVMLVAMDQLLGHRVALFAGCFSGLWFAIAFVLLTRPPGIPEFTTRDPSQWDHWGDEHHVVRRDVIPRVTLAERLRLSLTVACGSCVLIWLTLSMLGR